MTLPPFDLSCNGWRCVQFPACASFCQRVDFFYFIFILFFWSVPGDWGCVYDTYEYGLILACVSLMLYILLQCLDDTPISR